MIGGVTEPGGQGGRKYTFALLILFLATILILLDKLTGDNYVELIGATMLFFGATNVGEHWTKSKKATELQPK